MPMMKMDIHVSLGLNVLTSTETTPDLFMLAI